MLQQGYGFLVTTTKPDDAAAFMRWVKIAGREKDVRVFGPQHPWRFSLLEYAFKQGGSRGGGDTDNVVALLSELLSFKNRNKDSGGESQFWYDYAKKTLGHAIDMLACAGETVSFSGIYKVLQSVPRTLEEVGSEEWQAKSYVNQLVDRSVANKSLAAAKQSDLALALEFFLSTLPNMDERLRSNVIATLDSITYPFLRGQVATLCGAEKTTLSPENCFRGAIIILDLPIKEFHQSGQFIQVLWKRLWQQAAEKRDLKQFPRPLCLYCDEGQNFCTSYDALFQATARSSRVATVLMTQNLDSLQSQMGKMETEALLGNFNTKIFCSNDHVATNEWCAKTIGEAWVLGSNTNVSLGGEGSASGGVSEQRRFLVEPSEFVKLCKGGRDGEFLVEAIIFRSGRTFQATDTNHLRVFFPQKIGI
jgi:type IV secretory pathway TraG/TraD family ATPase VirD4